ncbi:cytochrome P450 [Sagittula stellata]|uniref:Cytochrome P450 n=1 Tax=Sagittula stellata (strain ATCC 700073 / DSM 11524 / E-37) TaxID=388399 RepID=A3JXH1_SAGS3|nr:cytochrome P450 [Sagittula stellata]EBA10207.1 cytochrome P450 [Sagittula stellata E-37]
MLDTTGFDLNAIGSDFIENPHPMLAALRQKAPLHRNPDGSVYLTRYDDVLKVYQSRTMSSDKAETFDEKFGVCPLNTHHTSSLVFNDPPYHTVVRKLLSGAFTPRKLAEFEPLTENIVDRLLDRVEEMGRFDLIDDFAKVLPTEIISFMLGIPEEHRARLRGYSLAILGALDPVVPPDKLEEGNRAVAEFGAILGDLIDHRRRHPDAARQGEVLQSLIFGEHDGRRLTREELIQNCIFLLNAGHETTTSLVGNAIGLLLDFPYQHRMLLDDPGLIATAVEEFLRVESPLQIGNRLAGEDIALSAGLLPKGTYIHTSIAGANRDPEVFSNPDVLDITRRPNRQIAFITGIHVCLGATLARVEGRIAVGRFVARFPRLALNGERRRVPLARFRGWATLPVSVR